MNRLRRFVLRVIALFRRSRLERELDEELRSHLEMLTEENLRKGMSPEEARYAALRGFGGVERVKEIYREQRGLPMIETLVQDLRYGLRVLRRSPGFTAVAILTLALSIGANTAIFTLTDAVLLKVLPVKQPEQLIELMTVFSGKPFNSFSYQALQQLREHNRSLSGLIASSNSQFYTIVEGAPPGRVEGQYVTGDFFELLGVSAALGRAIVPEDDRFGAPSAVAVISHGYWARRFGLDPAVLGKQLIVEGVPLTIVGVTGPKFSGVQVGMRTDLWVPLSAEPLMRRPSLTSSAGYKWLQLLGRLKPGASLEQARADLNVIFQQSVIEPELALMTEPEAKCRGLNWQLRVEPAGNGLSHLRQQFSKPLLILTAVVGMVLLIACANLANLLLARATA
jgi:predicted permease